MSAARSACLALALLPLVAAASPSDTDLSFGDGGFRHYDYVSTDPYRPLPIGPITGTPDGGFLALTEQLVPPGQVNKFLSRYDAHGDLVPKRLALLQQVVPSISRVGLLWNPANASTAPQLQSVQAAAPDWGSVSVCTTRYVASSFAIEGSAGETAAPSAYVPAAELTAVTFSRRDSRSAYPATSSARSPTSGATTIIVDAAFDPNRSRRSSPTWWASAEWGSTRSSG